MYSKVSHWRRRLLAVTAAAALVLGCTPAEAPPPVDEKPPRELQVGLLVVDDPKLTAGIERLLAEWKARSGATVACAQMTLDELLAAESLPPGTDAVIYPSGLLGTLTARGWLAPLPADFAQNRELAWSDTFELLQLAETRWGQTALAVPLGSPVFTCYYRPDLLEKFHRQPPRTWSEYIELAEFFADRQKLDDVAPPADAAWYGCAEPLAEGWAGLLLLARAAAHVKHRDHYSTLFNIETMEPLVAGAGYVRALEELVAARKLGPEPSVKLNPDTAREEFLQGHCALAIAWPSHAALGSDEKASHATPVGFIELPGAKSVYNFASQRWEERPANENVRVPLLGASGRIGSVTAGAVEGDAAFRFLAWLSGKDWGATVGSASSASPATTLYRASQIRAPLPWVDAGTDLEAARQYAHSVRDALGRQAYLLSPRIPGRERYLAALDAAVQEATSGQATPAEALQKAAAEWTRITDELGRDKQRTAYRQSLGLDL